MKKTLWIMPLLITILLVTPALAYNTTETIGDVRDLGQSQVFTLIEPNDNFYVIDKEITEDENSYHITGKIYTKWTMCKTCIRQIVIGIDENNKPIKCVYNGVPGFNAKEVKFDVTIPKNDINNVIKEYGKATIVASRHCMFNCGDASRNYKNGHGERLVVTTISPTPQLDIRTVAAITLLIVVGMMLLKW